MSDLAEKVQRIKPAEKFRFGEWLPDLPDLDNPGVTEASNVVWTGGSYAPYRPFIAAGSKVPGGTALSAFRGTTNSHETLYVASTNGVNLFLSGSTLGSFNLVDLTGSSLAWSPVVGFAQYGTTVIAASINNPPQYNTLDLTRQFSKLTGPYGDAPSGQSIGIIGQFVVIGAMVNQPNTLQWSSINQPFNWPTPGSAQAIASQAGLQVMDYTLGGIYGICQGDQWGLIILTYGLVRVQYVGGDTVFGFAEIYRGPSCLNPQAWVKFGGRVYLASGSGFLITDGVTVQHIGDSKVDRWFRANVGDVSQVSAGVDPSNKLIYWTFPVIGTGAGPNAWIAYNYVEGRWTHGTDGIQCFVKYEENVAYLPQYGVESFSSPAAQQGGGYGGTLSGTPTTAVISTAEIELNPGGRALLQGFRPQISGLPGGAATVRIGSRSRLGDQVAYTPALQLNGQTNFADALVDAAYHRAEVTLNGNFTQAIGGEFKAEPSGEW